MSAIEEVERSFGRVHLLIEEGIFKKQMQN
jgi:hypothetical protein